MVSNYRLLPLLLLLPRLVLPLEPDDRDGGDTEPRELLPDERGGATLRGRDGVAGLALLCGLDVLGRALVLPEEGRVVDDGRTPDGLRELPDGLTA